MTKLEKIVKAAKALRKKYPNKYSKWTDYIKAASKQVAGFEGVSRKGDKTTVHYSKKSPATKKKAAPKKATQSTLFGVKKAAPKKKAPARSSHKDTKSHNVNIRVMSGMYKLSGVEPHKGKYFIEWTYDAIKQKRYYDKMPKDVYRGFNGIYYMMVLTDKGTALTSLISTKTNKIIKRK